MHRAGSDHPDEFGLMAELARVPRIKGVVKWEHIYRCTVVGHVPFRSIVSRLTVDEVVTTIEFLGATIEAFESAREASRPRIGVAALNPHGGEGGEFGDEEQRVLEPAIQAARQRFPYDVSGPYPADTIWHRAVSKSLDGIVYLYHDQGNIAMKAAAFGEGVLIYAGLPYPVMAPGHGTAYEIAGQGRAEHQNIYRALDLAIEAYANAHRGRAS
jgi:4-hydroxythreonine-4-phosphate dehydrogenase